MSFEEQQYQVYLSASEKDRGSIKWSMSMMMPEHVSMLKERNKRDGYIPRPVLEQWELEDMQSNLAIASAMKCELEYKLWNNGKFEMHCGVITRLNETTRQFYYLDTFGNNCGPYSLDDVVDITPVDYREY